MAGKRAWTLISSHGAVLIEVARNPDLPVRELAGRVGLTDRHAYRMLADLCDEGYLVRERVGIRNHYRVDPKRPMRHPALADRRVGELLLALTGGERPAGSG
jgi:predicted DNA-binding transcriptional regulator YafY